MVISDQVIFDSFFYAALAISLIFGLLALLLLRNRQRMIFLFFFYILISLVEFLLFSGILVFIINFIFIFFFILLLAFSYNEDMFKNYYRKENRPEKKGMVFRAINLIIAVGICSTIGFLVHRLTKGAINEMKDIRNFNLAPIGRLFTQLFENYLFLVMIVAIGLFLSIIWFSMISEKQEDTEGKK